MITILHSVVCSSLPRQSLPSEGGREEKGREGERKGGRVGEEGGEGERKGGGERERERPCCNYPQQSFLLLSKIACLVLRSSSCCKHIMALSINRSSFSLSPLVEKHSSRTARE